MNFPLCLCELLDVVDFISLLFYSLLLFIYFLPAYEIICLFFELLFVCNFWGVMECHGMSWNVLECHRI